MKKRIMRHCWGWRSVLNTGKRRTCMCLMLGFPSHFLPTASRKLRPDLHPPEKRLEAWKPLLWGKMSSPGRKTHRIQAFTPAHVGHKTHEGFRYQGKWMGELRKRKSWDREMQRESSKWWLQKHPGWQTWARQRWWPGPVGEKQKTHEALVPRNETDRNECSLDNFWPFWTLS